ncbi:hypothetical protein [Nonomuraea dietziae]|uniref:hypothetical protein n=1 Tax=Nonomuraea dietziae TaxID=65515 RepID=UPI0033F2FEAD
MTVLLALLTVFASIAGIVQTVVVILERAERKRRERQPAGRDFERGGEGGPALRHDNRASFAIDPSRSSDTTDSSWRASLAYLLGFVGGLIFCRSRRANVRFHAVQSILIDIVAVVYFFVTLVAAGIYAAIRYPGPGTEIPSDDVVMWTWTFTSILGAPALHLLLAIVALAGRNPRVPLLRRVAARIGAYRPARGPRASHYAMAPAAQPRPERDTPYSPVDQFPVVWDRVLRHAGEEFRLVRGESFTYQSHGEHIYPDRTTIGIHRSNFARAWERRPLSGPGQISRDIMGPSYVYAILTDPRIAPE